ncbi:MAG: TetR/AcrR family transcriptional regulator [Fibrobacteres bacterium]|nr:TetR/AcrR family transcriptional regulator [Fibrobacterota bacterium]
MMKEGTYHHGDLREALLQQALKDLETTPAHELSVRDIAQRIGVSKAAPYRHFPTRLDFLAAICQKGFGSFLVALKSVPAHPKGPAKTLRSIAAAYIDFAWRNPWLYRLLFSAEGLQLASESTKTTGKECFRVLEEAAKEAQMAGWRSNDDPAWLASALWAHVHGVAMLRLEGLLASPQGRGDTYWEDLAGAMVEI